MQLFSDEMERSEEAFENSATAAHPAKTGELRISGDKNQNIFFVHF
jgi:hypothetical protein